MNLNVGCIPVNFRNPGSKGSQSILLATPLRPDFTLRLIHPIGSRVTLSAVKPSSRQAVTLTRCICHVFSCPLSSIHASSCCGIGVKSTCTWESGPYCFPGFQASASNSASSSASGSTPSPSLITTAKPFIPQFLALGFGGDQFHEWRDRREPPNGSPGLPK